MRIRLLLLGAALLLLAGCASKQAAKPRLVWIEVGANFNYYANDADMIAADCKRLADGGYTHVVVEVRPTSGDVLFKSTVAPELKMEALWRDGGLRYVPREADFDYLQAFIDAGHAAGLKVLAGVNMMVGGFRCDAGCHGMLYDHPEKRDWAAVDYTSEGLINHLDDSTTVGGRFMDPANGEVQEFLLAMLRDLAAYSDLDGVVLDRCRYDDYALDAGYTAAARRAFAEYLGYEPERWPVIEEPGHIFLDWEPDELENRWLTFRCKVIHDFVGRAVDTMHEVNPDLQVGVYVGAWFSEYYRSGVNWTSPDYPIASEEETYRWATEEYQKSGFADLVDFMILGAYCPADNLYGTEEKTMQGFASLGRKRLCGEVSFYCGPDIGNQPGFQGGGRAALLPEIAKVMDTEADGFFLFDLCYVRAFDYWDALRQE
jgi:uncharacterized lipoprotein YddW (UPF0748 family)